MKKHMTDDDQTAESAAGLLPEKDAPPPSTPFQIERAGGAPLARQEPSIVDVALAMISKEMLTRDCVEALDIIRKGQNEQEDRRARAAFNQDMAALQAEIPPLYKNRDTAFKPDGTPNLKADGTPVKKSWKYAPLPYMVKILKPLWVKHGFTQRFTATATENNRLTSTCIFTHHLGHFEETHFTALITNKQGDTLQDAASTDSFAKRYALMNALGIVPEEDMEQAARNDARMQGDTVTKVTDDQAEDLRQRCKALNFTEAQLQAVFRSYHGTSFETIAADQYAAADKWLRGKEGRK